MTSQPFAGLSAASRLFRASPAFALLTAASLAAAGLALTATRAAAADQELTITIKDHKFEPANPEVKAGERIKLTVVNADPTAEEFESNDFNVEKIVGGGKSVSMYVGPLDPGSYKFFGERHESTAQGTLTVK
jgi:plastocyanin